ncbi:FAE1_CUT1_RppA domain-containing protein/ACP_syn_III_C domain-containing protein [Cephalotus follicularis]|uniref:3-ketoacyl-CoA synthase n=1 Tax=Cephalotus follicularis TaxID=3775 RepID=A0A1Q3B010_CEPFO|nr:FAE1_CUT1_RppA domain-containing protein/ACP_syn_III_C domain-containing protein [Cephalotus follicularis]
MTMVTDLLAHFSVTHFLAASAITIAIIYYSSRSPCICLIDFACYMPPDSLRVPFSNFVEHVEVSHNFNTESCDFQRKVLEKSGIGEETCMPDSVHELPPNLSLKSTQDEINQVLFTVVKDLFTKHNICPKSIDILVSNCSLSCPTPSITAMIINKFGFRSDIKSISLSGMGCSAGILSISLAKDLLRVHKNSLALVLSMEAVAPNGYKGSTKSMLIANTIFRMGGAAILLSNRKQDKQKHKAKYKLQHLVRTHLGSDDQAYYSVLQKPDEDGHVGVSISRALIHVAGKALRTNISELAPLVLPYSEQLRYGWSRLRRKEIYVPNFKKAFDHFCIHAGGSSIIDAVKNNLKLQKEDGEASLMTLHRFGNTSSSSIWYELCYLEAKGRVKKGDKIWQIAFGSGFKSNSAVWKCISDINPEEKNAWSDRIHFYPVDIHNVDNPQHC